MIGKDYFKRQAATLRRMAGIAADKAVEARLIHMADDLEARASSSPNEERGEGVPRDTSSGPH
jgi:hypothetical protein